VIYKWQNVFQELEKRVSELPNGARLESESMLAKEFSVSRLTARKAVTELKKRGQVYADGNKTFVGYLTSDDPRFFSRRTLASRSIPEDGLSMAEPRFELALLERYLESMIRDIKPQLGDRCPHCRNYEYSEERSNDERAVWCSLCGKSRIYVCEGCEEKNRIQAVRIQFCRFCGEKRTPNASLAKGLEASR
jgi:DNA-binding transcriptional regulator YhcF (GntR family)